MALATLPLETTAARRAQALVDGDFNLSIVLKLRSGLDWMYDLLIQLPEWTSQLFFMLARMGSLAWASRPLRT